MLSSLIGFYSWKCDCITIVLFVTFLSNQDKEWELYFISFQVILDLKDL